MDKNRIGRFLSLILRHKPEVIGIQLDEHGWADVDELVARLAERQPFTREMLEEVVRTDEKQRYSFSSDGRRIRANQGHSIPVDVEPEEKQPPAVLYHGTGAKSTNAIRQQGLLPMSRLYVHLSADRQTAEKVGSRHGRPFVYRIETEPMLRAGYRFYQAANGVWLIKAVPPEFLKADLPQTE